LSNVAAAVLLLVFVLSIPASLQRVENEEDLIEGPKWPLWLVVTSLGIASVAAAFVSDWFIASLTPALSELHVSSEFAGLVIVAIAGNAIENFVGVKLAAQNRPDYALAIILQSPVQIAVGLIPVLVLLSNVIGPTPLTLVLPTLLLAVLALGTVIAVVVVFDGESTWIEGVALVGLYVLIATAFWWG
jgi:Ca2+:H+ antiporter